MSLGLVKKNSNSPFQLQRSMVDQGGEGGAYESGGYDPNNTYSDNGAASAIAGMGKIIGSSLASRTGEDINKSNVEKKSKLERKKEILEVKKKHSDSEGGKKHYGNRIERVEGRIKDKAKSIDEYSKKKNPVLTSDIGSEKKKELKAEVKKEETKPQSSSATVDVSSNDWRTSLLGWGKRSSY
jgi:hypothetical protein